MARTFIIKTTLIDEQTGKKIHHVTHSNSNLSPSQVCDIQDMLHDGVLQPLRKLARQMADDKPSTNSAQ